MANTFVYIGSGGVRLGGGARAEFRKRNATGGRRYSFESVSGLEQRRDGRGLVKIRRVIDRENDRYTEYVADYCTGEVLRSVDGPLSSHTGRGTER